MATTVIAVAAIASAAAAAAGTGVSIAASRRQSQAQKDAAEYNAQVARNNQIAAQQASNFETDRVRRRNRLLQGKQRAIAGKSGVVLQNFSDVFQDTAVQAELDALAAAYRGTVGANAFGAQSGLYSSEAKNISSMAGLSAAGTGLAGASQTAGSIAAAGYYLKKPPMEA